MAERLKIDEKIVNMPRSIIVPKYIEVDSKGANVPVDPISQEELEDRFFHFKYIK
jgi:hypothetical protein